MTLLSRRAAIASVPVGAVVARALLAEQPDQPAEAASREAGPEAARAGSVLAHLAPGTRVGPWAVSRATEHAGAILVTMAGSDGETCELELHARDEDHGAVLSPASTRSLAIFVRNGGSGETPTHEDHGLAALTLAEALSRVEGAGFSDSLSTLAEREAHPAITRA